MYKKLSIFIVYIIFLFIFATSVEASFSMSIISINPTSVLSSDQEVTLTASIDELPSPSYFRAEWQKSSGDTYFGYVKNNLGNWVKVDSTQDCTNYFSVTDTNTGALTLVTKIGSDNSPDNGSYSIKLRRYTSSCASSSDSDPITIQINMPTPIPTPTSSPTPTASPTAVPTKTASPTPVPTKIPTIRPIPTPSASPEVLGTSTVESATSQPNVDPTQLPTSSIEPEKTTIQNGPPIIAFIFVGLGVIFVGFSVYLAIKKSKTSTI